MKINKILTLSVISIAMFACGGGESNDATDNALSDLLSERDSLKTRLNELNQQIAELDTAAAGFNPIVSAENVITKDFTHKIEIQGSVETDQNAMMNAEAQGTIRRVHVKEGQKVSQGQALITLDAAIISSQIQEMQTQLELANYMFEKQKKLMEEGVGTEIEYEQAKAQKNSLESSIKTMQSQQGKTVVRAPFSGVIDEVMVSIGDMAAPGVPLLRIVNNKDVKITASLSENLLASVKEGTEVDLLFPSLNDTMIKSKITSRGNYIDPVNRTFRIRIDVGKNELLLPNMLAKVSVTDFERKDATVIPSAAILQDTKNNNYVYKLKKSTGDLYNVEKVFVEVLSSYRGESCVEAKEGSKLSDNDRVVVKGAKGITEADQVNIQ
jgi:membrane fusion protein (multidrug efflux system)